MMMLHINTSLSRIDDLQDCSFRQPYSLKQGINKFVEKSIAAAHKEM